MSVRLSADQILGTLPKEKPVERRTAAQSRRADDILALGAFDEVCGMVDELGAKSVRLKRESDRRMSLLFSLVAAASEHPELREHPDFKAAQRYVCEWAAKEVGGEAL